MGRRKTGAAPYSVCNHRGTAQANATIGGRRIRQSLGIPWRDDRRGAREIGKAAAEWYAKTVAGRVTERHARITTSLTLAELVAKWLTHIDAARPRSASMFNSHGARFLKVFHNASEAFADTAPQAYVTMRLGQAVRRTVQKEQSSLFNFYAWCVHHDFIASLPTRYELPVGLAGIRTGKQREEPVEVTPAEARAIIAALPEWSAPQRGWRDGETMSGRYRVRAVFVFAYATGLRPSTVMRLECPRHWAPGATKLQITEAIDKAKFKRKLPLTKAALAVLQECATAPGPIFGCHDYRKPLRKAAIAVLGAERGARFARYDFRHAFGTHVLDASQNLLGTARLLGHTQVSTTNRYLHAADKDAEDALRLAELGSDSAAGPGDSPPDP